jgi:hypothetical protein
MMANTVHWKLAVFLLLRKLASSAPNRNCFVDWTAHILVLYMSVDCVCIV